MAHDGTAGSQRGSSWLSAALLSLALLMLPLFVWLLLPRPAPFAPPRREAAAMMVPLQAPKPPEPPEAPAPVSPPPPIAPDLPATSVTPVRGVVLDPDGRPSAEAHVTCDNDPQLTASADVDGRFELPPEADGCIAIATQPPQKSSGTRVSAGRENVLRLIGGGAIAGHVVDEGGNPVEAYLLAIESHVPGASDVLASLNHRAQKIYDPAGAFLLKDLAPGRYVLTVSAAGRPPARSSGVDVEPGHTTRHVRIVLRRGATLTGKVTDADSHEPIANAQVDLDSVTLSGANAISLVLTDTAGRYELEGVPASGPFSVRVSHERYVTKIVPGLDVRGAGSLPADVELRTRDDGGSREELSGIGATLVASAQGVVVAGIFADGPAARAGLERGDRLVRIDGAEAAELPVSDCIQRLRGSVGTRVSVGVERGGQVFEVTVTREIVVR
jgi:hypothetical protein